MRQSLFINLLQLPVCCGKHGVACIFCKNNIYMFSVVYNNASCNNVSELYSKLLFYTSSYETRGDHGNDFYVDHDDVFALAQPDKMRMKKRIRINRVL